MDCPKCKAPMSECLKVEEVEDKTNDFGRRQITWIATHRENVHWVIDHYECSACGQTFSSREGEMQ